MANMSIKLNLVRLKSTVRELQGKTGKVKCVIIPIKENNLIQGEKGVYLNLTANQLKNPNNEYKQTHLIKQEVPKELYEKLSDDEKKNIPIIGNGILWQTKELEPIESSELDNNLETEDLPF